MTDRLTAASTFTDETGKAERSRLPRPGEIGEKPSGDAWLPAKSLGIQAAESETAVQGLLRNRLQTLTLVTAALGGCGVALFELNLRTVPAPAPTLAIRVQQVLVAGVTAVALALALLLASRASLSLRQLRALEVAFVFVGVLFCAGQQSAHLGSARFFHVSHAISLDRVELIAHFQVLPWFCLLTAYGIYIPNTRRRATALLAIVCACPPTVIAIDALDPRWPIQGFAMIPYVTIICLWTAFGAGLALYGAHYIAVLRGEAALARRLGQYELKTLLGRGGMGEVYLAEHVLLCRPCAVKLIRPDRLGAARSQARFDREVRVTATLTHPNTVRVFDYGYTRDGTFYYVMEHLTGLTMSDLVARHGRVTSARCIHFLRQMCGALREAHAMGLVHRDLKPGNIMICERGLLPDTVKLLDFGIVQTPPSVEGSAKLTSPGSFAGTPAYASPEQLSDSDGVEPRSDIYSLGCVAYFLLTERPPFVERSAVGVAAAHLTRPPQPLSVIEPSVPPDLASAVMRCLEKNPLDRFVSVEALDSALAGCSDAGQWTESVANAWWEERRQVLAVDADRPAKQSGST